MDYFPCTRILHKSFHIIMIIFGDYQKGLQCKCFFLLLSFFFFCVGRGQSPNTAHLTNIASSWASGMKREWKGGSNKALSLTGIRHSVDKLLYCPHLAGQIYFKCWPPGGKRAETHNRGANLGCSCTHPSWTVVCMKTVEWESMKWHSVTTTLWASLSDTFLQTLPDLVMPLKGHSLSPRSCPPAWSAPSKRFG